LLTSRSAGPAVTPSPFGRRRKKHGRSRITNGKDLFSGVDERTAWVRRFRDILSEIISDLGGEVGLSEGQRQLARRCATIAIQCEAMEGYAAKGENIDLDTYGTLTDRLGRAFQRLGLKRQSPNRCRTGAR
jgi:hypothetical protein